MLISNPRHKYALERYKGVINNTGIFSEKLTVSMYSGNLDFNEASDTNIPYSIKYLFLLSALLKYLFSLFSNLLHTY